MIQDVHGIVQKAAVEARHTGAGLPQKQSLIGKRTWSISGTILASICGLFLGFSAEAGSAEGAAALQHQMPSVSETMMLSGRQNDRDMLAWDFQFSGRMNQATHLKCTEVGGDQEVHDKLISATGNAKISTTVTLRGLKAETRYVCSLTAARHAPNTLNKREKQSRLSNEVTLITAPLPVDLKAPQIKVVSEDIAKTGYVLYNYGVLRRPWSVENRYLVILDAKGSVRWYYSGDGGGDIDATWLGNDQILFGGYHSYSVAPTIVGLDKAIKFKDATLKTEQYEQASSWNHDAGLSEDGESIFYLTYENNGIWTGYVIRQIDVVTDELLWTWSSINDGYASGGLPAGSSSDTDPYHGNAIDDQWENGRLYLYISMRNMNQVIKLDYETGEVLWHLGVGGDFELLEADGSPAADSRWFFNQHDAKMYGPNQFSVHDNGTERSAFGGINKSRGLRLNVDQVNMTAQISFEYTEANWEEPIWGGFDVLPTGNTLLALAHCWSCTSAKVSSLVEIDPSAKVVWRADFKTEREHVYRADRIDGCEIFNNREYCPAGVKPQVPDLGAARE